MLYTAAVNCHHEHPPGTQLLSPELEPFEHTLNMGTSSSGALSLIHQKTRLQPVFLLSALKSVCPRVSVFLCVCVCVSVCLCMCVCVFVAAHTFMHRLEEKAEYSPL